MAQDFDRIYAMSGGYSEQGRQRRPEGAVRGAAPPPDGLADGRPGSALAPEASGQERRDFPFQVEADLVVHGVTEPGSHVTIKGEPVRLKPDGTFVVRFRLARPAPGAARGDQQLRRRANSGRSCWPSSGTPR